MRLWTLHPKYLDCRGLVALWREALLAQAVLKGRTAGYLHHPQLIRFRNTASPVDSIGCYLQGVLSESIRRGYRFDAGKITSARSDELIVATLGQLDYEWAHLKEKLGRRAPSWLAGFRSISRPDPHPLFRTIPGPVAQWEIAKPAKASLPTPQGKVPP